MNERVDRNRDMAVTRAARLKLLAGVLVIAAIVNRMQYNVNHSTYAHHIGTTEDVSGIRESEPART